MKVKTYVKRHPRTFLAKELLKEDQEANIIVGKGMISTHKRSYLGQAIIKAGKRYGGYKVGGKAGQFRTEGHHWAVILK